MRILIIAIAIVALGGCASYYQPRYGHDGVYFDQRHSQPATVVVVDPLIYPFWSLDFFYFSRFYHPYSAGIVYRDPWFYRYPSRHIGSWPGHIDHRALVVDERLRAMEQRERSTRTQVAHSETMLRHRIAEDRAAARSRPRSTAAPSSATLQRSPASRPAAPARSQPAPSSRPSAAPRSERQQSRPPSNRPAAAPRTEARGAERPAQSAATTRPSRQRDQTP